MDKDEVIWDKEFDEICDHQYDDEVLNLSLEYDEDMSNKEREFYTGE